jgi:hypothetical protein
MDNSTKTFSLAEAQNLLPQLKAMLHLAKDELAEHGRNVESAAKDYDRTGKVLAALKPASREVSDVSELRAHRADYQKSIERLSQAQQHYVDCLETWIERISSQGVILRDIRTGLLDFPAKDGHFEYFLCWREEEDEIAYWHLANDGFIGRRPLAVLSEYI